MELTRNDFLRGALSAAGLGLFGNARLFAAPPGWKPPANANLVFGAVSDTHLCTGPGKSQSPGKNWPVKYFSAALKLFRKHNVDAVVHCGDFAHRGQTAEMKFHADVWKEFFPDDLAPDGHEVARLFVTGNHDMEGSTYGPFVKSKYKDKAVRAKHVLCTDMAANWEKIWGEPYEPVWHREVKGYHFVGRHFGESEAQEVRFFEKKAASLGIAKGRKPFFHLQHVRPGKAIIDALRPFRNAIGLYGHSHSSATNWNVVGLLDGSSAVVQVPACEPRGTGKLVWDDYITKAKLEGEKAACECRQVYIVRVYDSMLVIERYEVGHGGKLGADWIMPLGKYSPHPFARDELKKQIGSPQFAAGAELSLADEDGFLKVSIPRADGNPDSRVYAYEVVAAWKGGKMFKSVYAAGCNLGMGHEPDNGDTKVNLSKASLPKSGEIDVAVRPISSLGTAGKPIRVKCKADATA